MHSSIKVGAAVALAMAGWAMSARAEEEKVALDKVPKAVMDAAKAKFPGAEIKGAEKEVEDGKTIYEIGLVYKGQKIDASMTADGKVVSIEKEIEAADLPKAVAAAVDAKYPGATKKTIEEVEEDGKTTYEVLLQTSDKKMVEVVMDKAGKVLKTEDKKEKD